MSEKQQQPKTHTVMNDIVGSVATWSRCGGIFYKYFVTNLLLSLP